MDLVEAGLIIRMWSFPFLHVLAHYTSLVIGWANEQEEGLMSIHIKPCTWGTRYQILRKKEGMKGGFLACLIQTLIDEHVTTRWRHLLNIPFFPGIWPGVTAWFIGRSHFKLLNARLKSNVSLSTHIVCPHVHGFICMLFGTVSSFGFPNAGIQGPEKLFSSDPSCTEIIFLQ